MHNQIQGISFTLKEMGDFLAKFSEHSEQVYWISSPDFEKIQYVSPSYERVWGRSREELYNNPESWIGYLHPDDVKKHNPIKEMAEKITIFGEKARYSAQYRIIKPNGEVRWINDKGFPLIDNQGVCYGVTGVATDMTEDYKQTEALKIAKEAAEAANLAKDEFLANMSHDIRTPLSGIIGISSMLEQEVKSLEEKEHAHWVTVSGEQLLTLLNSVLDIVSVGKNKENQINLEFVDIHQLLQNIAELELPSIKLKGLELIINVDEQVPEFIITDPVKLHRIILNLLGNAIKFTEKGHVGITVKYNSLKEQLELSVSDSGAGIAKKNHSKVFDRFYRGDPSYKGNHTGFGVGLHIVQQYINLLEGTIDLESQLGKGTTFKVVLPAKNSKLLSKMKTPNPVILASSAKIDSSELIQPKAGAPYILLVEDNVIALKVAESILKQTHCQYVSAMNGTQALELAKTHNFDLILSDIGLPGLSGNELAAAVRDFETTQGKRPVPIVGITAHAATSAKTESLKAGMNEVLSKPITLEKLEIILKEFIKPTKNTPSSQSSGLGADLPDNEAELFILETFPLFDQNAGISTVGSLDILKELITLMFKDELPNDVKLIQEAYEQNNWDLVEKLAHKMKSSALYCGTIRLKFACQYLERYQKAGQTKLLNGLYQQLIAVVEKTKDEVLEWLDKTA